MGQAMTVCRLSGSSGYGIRIDDGHRPVVHFYKLDRHFRNLLHISRHHVQVTCKQHQRLAVRAVLDFVYLLDSLRVGGITSEPPHRIGRIKYHPALLHDLQSLRNYIFRILHNIQYL